MVAQISNLSAMPGPRGGDSSSYPRRGVSLPIAGAPRVGLSSAPVPPRQVLFAAVAGVVHPMNTIPLTSRMDRIVVRCNTDKASLGRSRLRPGQSVAERSVGHDYLRKYEFFLEKYAAKPDYRMMELGAGPEWNIGASVRLWEEYFWRDDFRLHVVDLKPTADSLANERVTVTVGDLGDTELLRQLAASAYDVILDDASHLWGHQLLAFEILFPAVREGGLYIIEDIETSFGLNREPWSQGLEADTYTILSHLAALVAGRGREHPLLSNAGLHDHPALGFWRDIESVTVVNDACLIAKTKYY